MVANKPKDFGNARYVRNLFEKAIEAQANRLASTSELSKDNLIQITKADLAVDESGLSEKTEVVLNHESYLEAKGETEKAQD